MSDHNQTELVITIHRNAQPSIKTLISDNPLICRTAG